MSGVHPTAIVAGGARLGSGVAVGPYCVVGSDVVLGDGVRLIAHVVIDGDTEVGSGCTVYPFAALGTRTQALKYDGGRTRVVVGNDTTIREYVTVNAGTADGETTRVGSGCLLMAGCHVAHNCVLGDGVIMANGSGLAGSVRIDDGAVIGGLCGVHQFVRIGTMSFCGGCSKIVKDIPPYMLADGNPARIHGLNLVGLRRRGMKSGALAALKQAVRILYRQGLTLTDALARIEDELGNAAEIGNLLCFIKGSQRGITRGMAGAGTGRCRRGASVAVEGTKHETRNG